MDFEQMKKNQMVLSEAMKEFMLNVNNLRQVSTPAERPMIPPITPTVNVNSAAVSKVLESIVENQNAQIKALQEQKEATEKELEEMKKQAEGTRQEARTSKRIAVASLFLMAAALLYDVWPKLAEIVARLGSAG